jgi:hypothetical protein
MKNRRTRPVPFALVFLIFALALPVLPARSQVQSDRIESARFQVIKATSEIDVDGVLDEPAWQEAAPIPLPFEWQPGDNIPAPVKTECLVSYDLHSLYIGIRCFDPDPKKIRAHLMDRDDTDTLILDDHVVFAIDAFNDERRAFQFRVNPMGVQADAIFSELEGSGTPQGRLRTGATPSKWPFRSVSSAFASQTLHRPGVSAPKDPGLATRGTA